LIADVIRAAQAAAAFANRDATTVGPRERRTVAEGRSSGGPAAPSKDLQSWHELVWIRHIFSRILDPWRLWSASERRSGGCSS